MGTMIAASFFGSGFATDAQMLSAAANREQWREHERTVVDFHVQSAPDVHAVLWDTPAHAFRHGVGWLCSISFLYILGSWKAVWLDSTEGWMQYDLGHGSLDQFLVFLGYLRMLRSCLVLELLVPPSFLDVYLCDIRRVVVPSWQMFRIYSTFSQIPEHWTPRIAGMALAC